MSNRTDYFNVHRIADIINKPKYALVLGGGGAKGAFHMGVWKALRELGVRPNAIIGTSVGALNGAMFLGSDYQETLKLWENICISQVINLPQELIREGKISIDQNNFGFLREFRKRFFKEGGLDTSPLSKLISDHLDEDKIRRSGIDFCVVTYQLSGFRPQALYLEDIPKGKLHAYLMASSTFPGFKTTTIEGKSFVDGGVYDNVPYSAARERGYRRIIVVDCSGLGMNRKPDTIGTETIYIKNSMDVGGIFDFDPETAKRWINLGYLDAMRVFGRLEGVRYYFYRDSKAVQKLEAALFSEAAVASYGDLLHLQPSAGREQIAAKLREVLPPEFKRIKYVSQGLVESVAQSLKVDRIKAYNYSEFLKNLWQVMKALKEDDLFRMAPDLSGFIEKLGGLLNGNLQICQKITWIVLDGLYAKSKSNQSKFC